ncbi:MAG: FkbM family methyltransferase [Prosthecobacter sp.]|nr:FkbM family methyltransferase [Prosthecobacter sp.]
MRPWLERLGLPWLSRPGLNGIDRRLAELLPQRRGWFVEAGANDGFEQSNTYYLERFRGWRGVLVEPEPRLAAACRQRRPKSQVVECALGAPDMAGKTVRLRCAGLMTTVCGALGSETSERQRAAQGLAIQGLPVEERIIQAPVRTLTEVLEESDAPAEFDLLSIDVEGCEVEVLKGLDLRRHRPKAICLEVRAVHLAEVGQMLESYYEMKEVLHEGEQHGDYFWLRRAGTNF